MGKNPFWCGVGDYLKSRGDVVISVHFILNSCLWFHIWLVCCFLENFLLYYFLHGSVNMWLYCLNRKFLNVAIQILSLTLSLKKVTLRARIFVVVVVSLIQHVSKLFMIQKSWLAKCLKMSSCPCVEIFYFL